MARSSEVIAGFLRDALVAAAATIGIVINPNNWSVTDYKRLFIEIFASSQNIQEQLYDSFVEDVEAIALVAPPQNAPWIQDKMLNLFEYNAITVPIVQFDTTTFAPYYPNPNTNNRIIKYCSVKATSFGVTLIKVASQTSSLPSQISATPLSAIQTFANLIGVPGIIYNVVSEAADRLFLQLDVYYNGLYSAVIEANVIAAINAYLAYVSTVQFDGEITLTDLEGRIRAVAGVNDVVLYNVQARANGTTVGTGTNLILNNLELQRNWSTVAGYIIPEDAISGTLVWGWKLTEFRFGFPTIKNLNLIVQ